MGWESRDWEDFTKDSNGHTALVRELKRIIVSKYHLKLCKFNKKEAAIAERGEFKPIHYVVFTPDLIFFSEGNDPNSRVFVEYVNTLGRNFQNYVRDTRGMLALSTKVKNVLGFVVVVRDSIFTQSYKLRPYRDTIVEAMSLKSFFFALDQEDYGYLVGEPPDKAKG